MYEHIEAETREHGVLELGVVVHDDRDNSHIGEEAPSTTNNILRIEHLSKYALVKELNSYTPFYPARVVQAHRAPCRPHCCCLPGVDV